MRRTGKRAGRTIAAAALLWIPVGWAAAGPAAAQEPPALPVFEYEGAIETGLLLRRLGQTARVLHVGAHPDDENTALLSTLALGSGADVAYLSLTRGEGGQNGIGPELGPALGVIRTEELLAARRLDGATQYFTRAIDFGFSKDAEETFTHWPKDSVLADVVAVIRHFRPDVVVSAWSGTRRDGHGQHEASGILAREAVLAAGDPARFPEQIDAGLRPHTVSRYYWSARYGSDGPDVELNTGELDPLLGRSYHQVAMASRSLHRSQDMGVPQAPGPRRTAFDLVDPAQPPEVAMSEGGRPARQLEGAATIDGSLFAGLDTLLSERARAVDAAPFMVQRLGAYEGEVQRALAEFDPLSTNQAFASLLGARAHLDGLHRLLHRFLDSIPDARAAMHDITRHVDVEARDLERALVSVAGLRFEATADRELVAPGETFLLELSAWNGGLHGVAIGFEALLPEGWDAEPLDPDTAEAQLDAGALLTRRYRVRVPGQAELTMPYFLDAEGTADRAMYEWPPDRRVGVPFDDASIGGRFRVDFQPVMVRRGEAADPDAPREPQAFARLAVERAAAFVGVDARTGEFRRPIRVVPRASLRVAPSLAAIPTAPGADSRRARQLNVTVRSDAPGGVTARLRPAAPDGWEVAPREIDVALPGDGAEQTHRFTVTPPADLRPGESHVGALLEGPGCRGEVEECAALEVYAHGYEVIDYPHIAPHHLYRPATARIRALDVRVADVTVGYVEGVPDGVPEALEDLGVRWEALDARALAEGDLSRYDVILAGTRAYELRPDLVAHNGRLLDWARAGGTLISLYNKYPALGGSYAPWPVTIARPHGRVTDEDAPITVLEPDAPVLNVPNRIGPADWEGWVQERGLYFWETWQGPLSPLLAMHDPGEAPLEGALLVGPLGEGVYVYNALALFRQLPEGVPGAYRLLANMISLGADE